MHSQHPATNDGSMVPPTRRTTRPKSQRRSAAVAIAAERGDLGAVAEGLFAGDRVAAHAVGGGEEGEVVLDPRCVRALEAVG